MLSKELESILQVIYADARMQRYEFIGIEHLLLSLVQESDEVRAVCASGLMMWWSVYFTPPLLM